MCVWFMSTEVHTPGNPRKSLALSLSTLSFETGPLLNVGLGLQPADASNRPSLPVTVQVPRAHVSTAGFLRQCWGFTLRSQAV